MFCKIRDCLVCQFLGMTPENVRWRVFENMVVSIMRGNNA